MLNQMRSGAGNFAAKILLALLVVSFAVWGIGDMLRAPSHNSAVAKVGSISITKGSLDRALRQEADNLRNQLGANYSPEILKSMRLPEQVLEKMIDQSLIKLESSKLGIIPSDNDVLSRIAANPAFQNDKGKFDKELFLNILRRNGMFEKDYVEQLRETMATGLLLKNLSKPELSDATINTIYQALEETRVATIYTLPASSINAPEPSAEQIEAYYKENGSEFSTKELRTASYISFKADDVLKNLKVEESDLRAVYNDRIEEFKRPERRAVSQLLFSNEESAKKAEELLKSGKPIEQVAKETEAQGKKPIAMGAIEKDKVLDAAADAVFALKVGESTGVIKSAFGFHIFQVSKIEAPHTLSFEEARPQLENDAKQHAAETALSKIGNQMEDSLAAGSSLAEVAKDAGFKVVSLGAFDKDGKTADGKAAKDLPDFDKFLEVLFKTDEKTESSLKTSKGGVYYIVRTESVIPEHIKPLEEVKSQVVEDIKREDRARLMMELAKKAGADFSDEKARAKYNFAISTVSVKRGEEGKLPPIITAQIFENKIGGNTGIHSNKNRDYLIATVKEIIPSKAMPTAEIRTNLRKSIESSMQNELMSEYMEYLKNKHSVSIDEAALQSMTKE